MDSFVIKGGIPLSGEMIPQGNKNAALPLMSATLLSEEPVVLHNMPDIRDVQTMRQLLQSLGVSIRQIGNSSSWEFHAKNIRPADLDPELCRKIRASILLAGPMTARMVRLNYRRLVVMLSAGAESILMY